MYERLFKHILILTNMLPFEWYSHSPVIISKEPSFWIKFLIVIHFLRLEESSSSRFRSSKHGRRVILVIIIQRMHSKKFRFTHYLLFALDIVVDLTLCFFFSLTFYGFLTSSLANFRLWLTNVFISTAALFSGSSKNAFCVGSHNAIMWIWAEGIPKSWRSAISRTKRF